ncbi:MAG: septation protein SepH [Janthinobacterium lividum]
MRTARLVGPTADGTSVVLVTEDGEELSVALDPDDPAVRSLLGEAQPEPSPATPTAPGRPAPARRPPPRRETPMDTPLSPRDIQTRVRGGESLEDLVAGSGTEAERIERFAAPVLAEREHLALTALGSSVRRRGEASGHRPLRSVVAERLQAQGVDGDDVRWDAWKVGDSQWQLSADYDLQGEPRHAEFRFDAQGRFSVAEDEEARWLAGEAPSPVAASIDRDDELALVRATREPSHDTDPEGADDSAGASPADTQELVRAIAAELGGGLQVVPPAELSTEELAELAADDPESDDHESDDHGVADEPTLVVPRDEAAEPTIAVVRHLTRLTVEVDTVDVQPGPTDLDETARTAEAEARSALDTLYDMLGGYAEESPRVYPGLTDAAAVPEVDQHEFEPPASVLVPVEPDLEPDPESPEQDQDAAAAERVADGPAAGGEAEPKAGPGAAESVELVEAEPVVGADVEIDAGTPVEDDAPEPLIPSPGASRNPGRRRRASVPSWDEIMFGGPKPG